MLGEIAIIALAIFNQFSLISADQNRNVFLSQFVDFGDVYPQGKVKGDLTTYLDKFDSEGEIASIPTRTKSSDLELNAVAAFAMDADADYPLYDKNSKKRMPIASLTKIMTATVVLENAKLDDTVTITPRAMEAFGDKKGLVAGEKIRLEDLMRVMLIDSNNAAAVALAEHTGGDVNKFVEMMNVKAAMLGLKDTHFVNPTGLDGGNSDNYSTAYDLAQLIDSTLDQGSIWEMTRTPEVTVYSLDKKQKHHIKNTDELLGQMNNIYGGKTGYTADAGECLALITETADKKRKVISVVLNASDRFLESKKLSDWIFDVYRW